MPIGSTYTPVEIYNIVRKVDESHGGHNVGGRVKATAIIIRESGGNARAYRDATKNPGGGNDRGWWQFNTKYWPNVTDEVAYDPVASTEVAYKQTNGFDLDPKGWKPWSGAPLTPELVTKAATAAKTAGEDFDADDNWFDTIAEAASDATQKAEEVLTPDWLTGLSQLLANLLSPTWWKRLGIGALGVAIIIIAFIIIFGKDIADEVKP